MGRILQFPDIYKDPNDPEEDMRRANRAWQLEVVDPITEQAALVDFSYEGSDE